MNFTSMMLFSIINKKSKSFIITLIILFLFVLLCVRKKSLEKNVKTTIDKSISYFKINLNPVDELVPQSAWYYLDENECEIIGRGDFCKLTNSTMSILEIGPFNNPSFTGENVKYFDVNDRESLIKRAQKLSFPTNNIPLKIDFVSENGDITIIKDIKFDVIYSSHNIEHLLDVVEHLNQVYELLNSGGFYMLVIPDKRYCFDHFKAETSIPDVLFANYMKIKRHSLKTHLHHCEGSMNVHNNPANHWANNHGQDIFKDDRLVECYRQQLNEYLENDNLDPYQHKWQFTPTNFVYIINTLARLGLIKFKIEKIYCTALNTLEFYVVLKKSK